jgi:deoxyribonuclease-2
MIPKSSSATEEITFGYFDSASTTIKYMQYKKGNFPPITMTSAVNIKTSKNVNYFFWNDDTGSSTSSTKAHSKGALVYDKDGGYLISHSLPRFPEIVKDLIANDFPENAGIYAQSWLCISITKENAITIAGELNIINPQVYINIEEDQVDSPPNPVITKLIKNRGDPKLPDEHESVIQSKGKVEFDIFAKSKDYNDLQWDIMIPKTYEDNFYSETWTRPERLPNVCSEKFQVLNVLTLKFGKFEFGYDNEHSKWGVAQKKGIACFGDLNRTESQKSRGGMVICFENTKLAEIIRSAITDYEKCKKKSTLVFLSEEKN